MSSERVIVFLKAPRPGLVKTRMRGELDEDAVAAIYCRLAGLALSRLEGIAGVELRFTPDDASGEVAPWARAGWRLRPQGDGDLGARLERAVEEAVAEGVSRIVIIGSDCPEFTAADIVAAFGALRRHDVVLGPAVDGGYWLIGMTRCRPELLRDIPWSTAQVLDLTRERARASSLTVCELRQLRDIDTLEDWRRWLRESPL